MTMKVFLVDEIESEAGWGSRREDQYIFPTSDLAKEFCMKYDEKYNNEKSAPSWYMKQEYQGEVKVNKEKFEKFKYKGDLVKMPDVWEYEG